MSFAVLFVTVVCTWAQSDCDKRLDGLYFTGKVLQVSTEVDKNAIYVQLKIETTFINRGLKPFIVLKPWEGDKSGKITSAWSGGIAIFGRNEHGAYFLQSNIALPSVCRGCDDELGKLLDKRKPPESVTRVLMPGENWTRNDQIGFMIPLKSSGGMYGWKEIETNRQKIIGKITYSMFPTNLESYKKDFGKSLKKRWEKFGVLFVCGTQSLITSGPFEIDLTSIKL